MNAKNLQQLAKVIAGERHRDYTHVVDSDTLLTNIATAEKSGIKALLERFIQRESEEEFNERVKLTRLTTRALFSRIMNPFNKALRADNANITITEKSEQELFDKFFGDTTLYSWLGENYHPAGFYSPNSFLLLSISDFDFNTEKTKIEPQIIDVQDALWFEFKEDKLIRFIGKFGDAFKFYGYGQKDPNGNFTDEGNVIKAVKTDREGVDISNVTDFSSIVGEGLRGEDNPVIIKIGKESWLCTEHEPKIEGIQLRRIGYKKDVYTKGRTVVSPIYPAIPRIESTIKSTSEMQISIAMHVFAQKIVQVEDCKGWRSNEEGYTHYQCNGGTLQGTNRECPNCGGSGLEPIAKNAMDVIRVKIGEGGQDDHDLDNIVRYIRTDVDTPKFLAEYLDKLEEQCLRDVYHANSFSQKSVEKTATESGLDQENLYDAILPYVRNFEETFSFCMKTGMALRDQPETSFKIRFPDDFEIKTLSELISDYRSSEGLPVAVRKSLRKRIARKLSVSTSGVDQMEAVRIIHEPFVDKSSDDIKYIIGQNLTTVEQRILWANYDDILSEMEATYKEIWPRMSFELQKQHIEKAVNDIKAKLNPEVAM